MMKNTGEKEIDNMADELINHAILDGLVPANEEEEKKALKAIRRYNFYVEALKKEPIEPDIPTGMQDFIGRVQTSNISRPTQAIALARILEEEKRKLYAICIHAVDKGIEVASYRYQCVKADKKKGFTRKSFEIDIRKRLSLEVGK